MTHAAEIFLWGTKIGTVWKTEDDICAKFFYDDDFVKSSIELSPFRMPLSSETYIFPELSRLDSFHGMPGLLADSLPDRFGNAVINEWLQRHGRNPESFSAIERLCYTGKRGMGALEYVPATGPVSGDDEIDVNEMADFASQILSGKEKQKVKDWDLSLARMMEIGSSAGGARAKAVIAWNEKTGEVKSGQIDAGEGFSHWLIKFDGVDGNGDRGIADKKQHTLVEYAYYLMALDAGINMQECQILKKDGRSHFMTLRYDREGNNKIHVQTLAALGHFDYNQPRCCSYEEYAGFAAKLNPSLQATKELYRRAVFNILAMNCDDHVKNFSFMMNKRGEWKMAPAYDITFAFKPNHIWLGSHQMTLNGKDSDFESNDLIAFGKRIGLSERYCREALGEISNVVNHWMDFAEKCGINEKRAKDINGMLLKF